MIHMNSNLHEVGVTHVTTQAIGNNDSAGISFGKKNTGFLITGHSLDTAVSFSLKYLRVYETKVVPLPQS